MSKVNPKRYDRAVPVLRAWIASCVALALLLWTLPVAAATFPERELSGLCSEAEIAFVGTVKELRSQWADPDQRAVETLVTFSDITVLFGTLGDEVTLRFAGGEIDGIHEQVAGLPRFSQGERVILLGRLERSASPIVGFNQGLFKVIEGPEGPAVSSPNGLPLVQGGAGGLDPGAGTMRNGELVPLDTFLSILRVEFERR